MKTQDLAGEMAAAKVDVVTIPMTRFKFRDRLCVQRPYLPCITFRYTQQSVVGWAFFQATGYIIHSDMA